MLHRYLSDDGQAIFHCLLERNRIARTVQLLEALTGVMKVEILEMR